jgi:DNA-binding GntR family transcriptional regulator
MPRPRKPVSPFRYFNILAGSDPAGGADVRHRLCEVAVRLERQQLVGEYGYELPMTQEQLADTLGLTAVHVNRTLKSLDISGLIKRAGRGVRFVAPARLQDLAGFTSNYLHLVQQRAAVT